MPEGGVETLGVRSADQPVTYLPDIIFLWEYFTLTKKFLTNHSICNHNWQVYLFYMLMYRKLMCLMCIMLICDPLICEKPMWLLTERGLQFTKRCRLSWLTNSALVYEPMSPNTGERGWVAGSQPMGTAVHRNPKKNFGDLTPYLTYV